MTRIERAARAIYDELPNPDGSWLAYVPWEELPEAERAEYIRQVGMILLAAEPELYQDPPTHWRAPMEATEEMLYPIRPVDRDAAETDYRAMRAAHLKDAE